MDCREILERISAYIDGDLDATDCRAIDEHCAGCHDCAVVVAGLRRTIGLCRQAADNPLPEDVRARASARVRKLLLRAAPATARRKS